MAEREGRKIKPKHVAAAAKPYRRSDTTVSKRPAKPAPEITASSLPDALRLISQGMTLMRQAVEGLPASRQSALTELIDQVGDLHQELMPAEETALW